MTEREAVELCTALSEIGCGGSLHEGLERSREAGARYSSEKFLNDPIDTLIAGEIDARTAVALIVSKRRSGKE